MLVARAIVAVVLAVAVALLPASGGAAFAAQANAPQHHDMAAAPGLDSDHDRPCDHAGSKVDDCASISVCALKCFTYAGVRLPSLATPLSTAREVPYLAADDVDSRGGAPPFRPPRA